MTQHSTSPAPGEGIPRGIPYIIVNEAAERFNFYGLQAILLVFMTDHLLGSNGQADPLSKGQAMYYYHLFISAVYFFPFLGGIISDAFFGKYHTILYLSLVYCAGSVALAVDSTRLGLLTGLTLVAIGSGGIKPCVSALVGDQFGARNSHLMSRVYGWFYFSINAGSSVSMLLTPWFLERFGPRVAFGVPGIFMLMATLVFWLGRHRFVRVGPSGMGFVRETFSLEGLRSVAQVAVVYTLVAMFWALYYQNGSAWVLQAKQMNCRWLGVDWLPSQMQAANPFLILGLIPLFSYVLYPAINRVWTLTPLRKIGLGLFLTVPSFLLPAWLEWQIGHGIKPSIGWQFVCYVIISAAEVMVSITSLEFAYTQAPKKMKSLVMSLYLLSMSLGNVFTAAIEYLIQNPDGTSKLAGPNYYLFFAGLMLATAVGFVFYALTYKEKVYLQDEAGAVG